MGLELRFSQNECHISEISILKQLYHVLTESRFGDLYAYREYPNIIEAKFTIVASEDIELTFYNIGCVTAPGTRFVSASLNFVPPVQVHVKHVHIIHPLYTIITTKIVNLLIY